MMNYHRGCKELPMGGSREDSVECCFGSPDRNRGRSPEGRSATRMPGKSWQPQFTQCFVIALGQSLSFVVVGFLIDSE